MDERTGRLIERLAALEASVAYDRPAPHGRPSFSHLPGRLPVLISAPHGAAHRRNGRFKPEDEYTASVARLVAAESGAHVLFSHYRSETDPNWDPQTPYKRYLGRLVEEHGLGFVLDLHGMSNRYKIGLAVGTINGRSCPEHEPAIVRALAEHGFVQTEQRVARRFDHLRWDHFVVNHSRFTGGVISHTVTRYAAEQLGVPAAQIELCAQLRVPRRAEQSRRMQAYAGDPAGIARAIDALAAVVRHVANRAL